jgi:hypothetical protein
LETGRPTQLFDPEGVTLPGAPDDVVTIVDFRKMLQDLANEYRSQSAEVPFQSEPPTLRSRSRASVSAAVAPGIPEWVWAVTGGALAMLVQSLLWLWLGPS